MENEAEKIPEIEGQIKDIFGMSDHSKGSKNGTSRLTSHLLSAQAEQSLEQALKAQNIQYTHTKAGIVITASTAAEINIAKSLYNAYSAAMPGTTKTLFMPTKDNPPPT